MIRVMVRKTEDIKLAIFLVIPVFVKSESSMILIVFAQEIEIKKEKVEKVKKRIRFFLSTIPNGVSAGDS